MIGIHQNQEELLELESFIKGISDKMKLDQQMKHKMIDEADEEEGDEDEDGVQTDSSDSEEDVKNMFV